MKYYLHDSSSFDDEKITELYLKFGYEGLGLFYTLLEKLAKQEKPIKTSVLKSQLKVGKRLEKCWSFMESLGIICSNNGETFNKKIVNATENYSEKKEKNKEKISEWRKNQQDIKNVTSYEPVTNGVRNPSNISKVNSINSIKPNGLLFPVNGNAFSDELKKEYFDEIEKLKDADPLAVWEWHKNFVSSKKPMFHQPYFEMWNMFAGKVGLTQIKKISDDRAKKMNTRLKDTEFDFVRILEAIQKSKKLKGQTDFSWKVDIDHVIENGTNYLKILEGKWT